MTSAAAAYKRPPAPARFLAAFLSLLLGLGPLATPAYAAVTALADQPLGAQVQAKPNVILTVDDSTSMLYDFLPDITVGTNCRDGTGGRNAACGWVGAPYNLGTGGSYLSVEYIYEQYGFPFPAYTNAFTASGPGAGCNLSTTPPTCSPGISPGPSPGIKTYPATSGSPAAGKPYEYWLLWPAPAHNSAMNALYYNPMLTYSPAVASDGTPYPSMNSSNTTGWTLVPANPFLHLDNPWGYPTDPLAPLVDLTATVTVGQWCNSDWTQGNDDSNNPFATNQSYCRSNGNISAADSDSTPANIGDYNYPWAPASITPNDYTTKVDMSTINITSIPPVNATVKPAWANAKNGEYFYENDNVLWCDISSPAWPQAGSNPLGQTCINKNPTQTCTPNPLQPTCGGGSTGTCGGAIGAGTCTNPAPIASGTCSGGAPNGQCNNYSAGVCSGYQPGTCAGGTAPTCNNIPTCGGFLGAACSGQTRQACGGFVPPSCGGMTGQTCNGGTPISCNPQSQVCNGYGGPQTCNLTLVNPDPSTCPSQWVPPGCNLDPDPESGCQYIPVCTPYYVGACSISSASCQHDSDCPTIFGACSVQTSKQCSTNADCTGYNLCAGSTTKTCTTQADCGIGPGSGTCSATGTVCTVSTDCPSSGTCNNPAGLVCTSSAQCTAVNGTCAVSGGPCASSSDCPFNAGSGTCNYKNNGGVTNGSCSANTDCQNRPNTCSAPAGQTCATIADCTAGTCVLPVGQSCTANAQCTGTGNTCQNSGTFGNACATNGNCAFNGTCTNPNPATTACQTNAQCTTNGTCAVTNAVCTTNSSTDPTCKVAGTCTTGNVGATCFSSSTTDAACAKSGACSYNNTKLCTSNSQCPAVAGTCTGGTNGSCFLDSDCTVNTKCSNSQNNGAACTTVANCTPLKGTCSDPTFGGNACTTASDCAPIGVCSIVPTACVSDANCQPVNGPLNPVLARCDTTGVSGGATATLLADANGPGLTCRRNNHAYADGTTASRYNYPSGNFTTPVSGEINAGMGCSASPHFANVPRHYWKTSVEWCDTAISTAADKWLGYGDITQGTCQASSDTTHIYPRFYQFGSETDAVDNYATAAFAREDLTTGNTFTHTSTDVSGQTTTVTRTYAQEMENYANWFAYYRDRIQAVKTATSLSFLGKNTDGTYNLDETKFRVGLHTLSNNPTTSFVNIQDFDLAQKALWATQLFDINIQLNQETPSLNAMARIGDYFTNGTSSTLAGATDPIVLSCQKNWHMFFTDGITNQPVPLPPLATPDTDNNVLMLGNSSTTTLGDLTVGSPWPAPYREDSTTATDNSLSDYATQYWSNDMRSSGPVSADNVPTTNVDPANWQHLNFAALSLGTQGKLAANNQTQVLTQLTAGTLQWPVPYPSVNKPDASGVDDLWHAAVNGRGRFVNAKSVAELQVGMGQILADALNSQGSRSAATFTNNNLSTTADSFVYEATFQPSWGGTLAKYLLNPTDGTTVEPALWHAETQLAQMLTPTTTIPNPWRDSRKVVTMTTSGTPVPFLWANLSAAQQDALAPGNPARGQLVLAYLRGDQSNEGATLGQFRERNFGAAGALGDIVDSSAAYAGPPNMPYLELYDPGYSTFKSTWASRPGRVYVGANDGMLHAFDDATGNETFGYIPRQLFSLPTSAGLGALTYQFGGLPPFVHHFLVDSTPTITDVAFGDPSSQDWHTLLVGGLGKGGQAYYAIDVTNPGAITSETLAASTVKWEFTDPDMGYTYGPPLVTKTRAYGGQWVVVVPSGYNNASGVGKLWFLDAATGSVLTTMTTGDGSPTDPSGLAQISGYTQYYVNYLADQIYAGDLHGNVWRFDIMDPNPSNWTVSKLAVLTDPSGTRQPVTIRPQIQIDLANATDRWVFVGTGKLLDDSDLSNTQVQTFYALRDGNTKVPSTIDPANPIVRSQLDVVTTSGAGLTAAPAVGWLQDLTDVTGQRVVTPIVAVVSIVAYAATSPNTDPCITGQPAEIFARSYSHGDSRITDDSGSMLPSIYSADGAVGINIVSLPTGASSGGGTDVPQLKGEITLGSTGKVIPFNVSFPPEAFAHRMSWRVLNE